VEGHVPYEIRKIFHACGLKLESPDYEKAKTGNGGHPSLRTANNAGVLESYDRLRALVAATSDEVLGINVGDKFAKTTGFYNDCFEWKYRGIFGSEPEEAALKENWLAGETAWNECVEKARIAIVVDERDGEMVFGPPGGPDEPGVEDVYADSYDRSRYFLTLLCDYRCFYNRLADNKRSPVPIIQELYNMPRVTHVAVRPAVE
jgi:hypothetical protein